MKEPFDLIEVSDFTIKVYEVENVTTPGAVAEFTFTVSKDGVKFHESGHYAITEEDEKEYDAMIEDAKSFC